MKMTPAQKRNDQDLTLAYEVELAARKLLICIEKAQAAGLNVNANAGTRYERIGGYVRVHRHMKLKTLKVLEVNQLRGKP